MIDELHHKKLERLFLHAPIQANYPDIRIHITEGKCTIHCPVSKQYFHGGEALHGSQYFKLLDDAAYFACASLSPMQFLVTSAFEIRFIQPVTGGLLTATAICDTAGSRLMKATAELRTDNGELLASGAGSFVPTATKWDMLTGYQY